jgi:hypothetical protein
MSLPPSAWRQISACYSFLTHPPNQHKSSRTHSGVAPPDRGLRFQIALTLETFRYDRCRNLYSPLSAPATLPSILPRGGSASFLPLRLFRVGRRLAAGSDGRFGLRRFRAKRTPTAVE